MLSVANLILVAILGAQTFGTSPGQIVFVCNRDGADNICVADSSASGIHQITFGKENKDPKGGPKWSPNHDKVAFHQRTAERMDIYTMNADGSNVQQLTNSDGSTLYRNPAWSPDGSHLALEFGSRNLWDICAIASTGSELRKLTDGKASGGSSENPDWSPDGKRIVFQSNRGNIPSGNPPFRGSDIYVMNVDGSNVERLTITPAGRTSQNPAWSPDGRQIAFASTRDGDSLITDWEIYVMRPDGTEIQQLTHDRKPFGYGHPRWSPDGQQFIFHSNREGVQGAASEVELYVIAADGTNMRRLTRNQFYDGFADWR